LGNLSIIALPNSEDLAKKVSQICKGREWYKLLAPIMLKHVAEKIINGKIYRLAKYMLLSYKIPKECLIFQYFNQYYLYLIFLFKFQLISINFNPYFMNYLKWLIFNVKIGALLFKQIAAIMQSNLPIGLPIFSNSTSNLADKSASSFL